MFLHKIQLNGHLCNCIASLLYFTQKILKKLVFSEPYTFVVSSYKTVLRQNKGGIDYARIT